MKIFIFGTVVGALAVLGYGYAERQDLLPKLQKPDAFAEACEDEIRRRTPDFEAKNSLVEVEEISGPAKPKDARRFCGMGGYAITNECLERFRAGPPTHYVRIYKYKVRWPTGYVSDGAIWCQKTAYGTRSELAEQIFRLRLEVSGLTPDEWDARK